MASGKIARTVARASLGTVAATGLLFGSAIPTTAAAPDQPVQINSTVIHRHPRPPSVKFLALINGARQHPELYPPRGNTAGATMTACPNALTYSTALHNTAMAHNDYLASQPVDWVNTYPNMHKDPNGKMAWDAGEPMDQAGYHSARAEIVADGFPTTDAALQFWMQDDAGSNWGHRNLILDCTIQDAGPAILAGGPAGHYYTVDMGNR